MKRTLFIISIAIFLVMPDRIFSLGVDVDEIKNAKKIEFENYTGKVAKTDPASEVRSIGYQLADKAIKGQAIRYHLKYSVIRAISKEEPDKFSADIFSIDKDAGVTHIAYVQKIIEAYLERMYGYRARSARALSVFITYYNAAYRGDIDYITSKYKSVVLKNITKENAGISTKYYEWPGSTRMLIPLTESAKKEIDPDLISDDSVKKKLPLDRETIKDRKELVDIKEKKIEKDKKEVSDEKKEIEKKKEGLKEEKKQVIEEKKKIDEKKETVKKKEEEIKKEKEEVKKITDPVEKKKKEEEIIKKEETVKKEKEEVKKKEEGAVKKEEVVKKKEEVIKKEETKAEEKKADIAKREERLITEKKEITEDEAKLAKKEDEKKPQLTEKERELAKKEEALALKEKELKEKEKDKNILGDKFYYMKINEWIKNSHYNNDMYMINAATRKIEFKSPANNIGGNKYDLYSGGVIVITRQQAEYSNEYNLTLLDKDTLVAKITGSDPIFYRSFVEIRDGFVYAILVDKDKFYLGRFDSGLKLMAKSSAEISENTFITFYEDFIYINSRDKQILVLKKSDLSQVDMIKP